MGNRHERRIDKLSRLCMMLGVHGKEPVLPMQVSHTAAGRAVVILALVLGFAGALRAQYEPLADQMMIEGKRAATWAEEQSNVVQVEGPVRITLDKTTLTAGGAVIWMTPLRGLYIDQTRVEIALVGEARIDAPNGIMRSGPRLFVTARVRRNIRMAAERAVGEQRQTPTYQQAAAMRPVALKPGESGARWIEEDTPLMPATQPSTRPGTFRPKQAARITAERFVTVSTPENTMAAIASGGLTVLQRMPNGDFLELQADRAVIFTPLRNLKELGLVEQIRAVEEAVTGIYLEGDVRINRTPAGKNEGEQRLTAQRAYYDLTTDRAVLTDVVLHTTDPRVNIPVIIRARLVRQLAAGEFTAERAKLTSSSFHTPSYHIGASSTYIRQSEFEDSVLGTRTTITARDATFNISGVPVFWMPAVGATVTERSMLRNAGITNSSGFGVGVVSEWGLFETIGKVPPPGLDASYRLDYYSDRGPGFGVDAKYAGGTPSETTLQNWSFAGDFTSYMVIDDGTDHLGRNRTRVTPDDEIRGRFYWEHQHYLPGDWQVQMTGGYITDPTFMEEWFNDDFKSSRPLDTSLYLKRQRQSEAITFLSSLQTSDFATVSELYQEQFEIQRWAELGYRRIGDSVWGDSLTFFSANTVSALAFDESDDSLRDLGFGRAATGVYSPGLPASGYTGTPDDLTFRGDFRQELSWPFSLDRSRMVPYVVGRYSQYSESPGGGSEGRVFAAAGLRWTTAFWKVDDQAQSRLLDINRLRHVIEPQMNLFVSASSADRDDLLIYDESIDSINDIGAWQIALNQRWQTKRGGPGRWRSVDFFRINTSLNLFFNEPDEISDNLQGSRGLFFFSQPETSVARDSVNLDAEWTVSDSVRVYGDLQYNLEESELATAGAGMIVRQGRVSYFTELRHIGLDFTQVINGNTFRFESQDLLQLGAKYELTSKYSVAGYVSYDLAQSRDDSSLISLTRQFDRFFMSVSVGFDNLDDETFFYFNVWPEGMEPGKGNSRSVTSAVAR